MNQSINTDSKSSKEPQQKYRLGTVSIKNTGGFKPVLQAPNLAILKSDCKQPLKFVSASASASIRCRAFYSVSHREREQC